ncbi:mannan endo-1,4-beta-mannosidase [Plectosphaerella cucumerina]|uniref:Mannan endo-1,4-beta-mannosidase n=1 Tax=Plectosphaerella cucumerina TaxID=40658 RepID=A0A8K0X4M5_9PEZI|nr:mannan endo-1,4-beta-mannosidase [Plectosphaerella cucumerina]
MVKSFVFLAQIALAAAALIKRCDPQLPTNSTRVFEAEAATLSGNTRVATEFAGFTGTGYVTGFEAAADKISFTVPSTGQHLYDLTIRYAAIYGDKYTHVVLNNGAQEQVHFPAGDAWAEASAGSVLLNDGVNKIDIITHWGWYLVDSITVTPTAPRPPHNVNEAPVNPNADAGATALYNLLRANYGKKILSGQQEVQWADWIQQQVGKTPAILGLDLMDYSPSRVEFQGHYSQAVEQAIAFNNKGGIVTFCWHWNAPVGLYNTAERPWYSGFYTDATDFNVATALADTTNANYTLIIRDIDAIAVELKRLEDAGVPVLFRPLHEAEGKWFWWGAQGPEYAKQLWDIVYERLTNHHGINNLIWVWNSVAEDWYPGDATVDVLSADVYAQGNGPMSSYYNQLVDLGNDQKLIAATEVGSAPLPDLLKLYEAHWSWFCVWNAPFINDPEWNSPANLETIYNHEYVLTLDEIEGWREEYA